MKVTIFIKGLMNETYEIDRPLVDESRGFHIGSRAKVCPGCLGIWAWMRVETDPIFGIESQFCEWCCHKYFNGVPGSLLDDRLSWTVDWDLIRYLPEPLLRREFELHVRIERNSHNEQSAPYCVAGATEPLLTATGG